MTPLSRREFHAALALLAAAPFAATGTELVKDAVAAATEALTAIAKVRYGSFLTAEQTAEVEKAIRSAEQRAEMMKKFPLKNSDEPAFAFSADVP